MSKLAIFPSNSPAESYPENITSNFTIPLSDHLKFPTNENWKVGLIEAQIPISFYNLDDTEDQFITIKHEREVLNEKIPSGSYSSASDIVDKINKIYDRFNLFQKKFDKIYYIEVVHSVLIRLKQGQKIVFSPRIAEILGFPQMLELTDGQTKSKVFRSKTGDPWKNFHHLFIYSDLVENKFLNSDSVPLLGTVSIENFRFGSLVIKNYLEPELVKPRYSHYSSVNFQIRNELNQLVRFRAGSVVLKLIFTDAGGN